MIQLYDRDGAAVADLLTRLVEFRRARDLSQALSDAYDQLRAWTPTDIVETDTETKRELVNARIESIVAALNEQLSGFSGAD
jgi:hypothetical protein